MIVDDNYKWFFILIYKSQSAEDMNANNRFNLLLLPMIAFQENNVAHMQLELTSTWATVIKSDPNIHNKEFQKKSLRCWVLIKKLTVGICKKSYF